MNSDILIKRVNKLENWLEQTKGKYHLYPIRSAGYMVLIIIMMVSNLVAVIRWPFAHFFKKDRSNSPSFDQSIIHEVNDQRLQELIQQHELVLVDFWTNWCGPCIMMEKSLEKIAQSESVNCTIAKVNTVIHPKLAEKHNVKGLPTLKLFKNGEEVKHFAGAMSFAEIKTFIAE